MDRVWHILPDSTENEESVLTGQVAQVIASEDGAANNAQQIIYVSYQDPDDPLTSTKTLQLGNTKLVQLKSSDYSLQSLNLLAFDWLFCLFIFLLVDASLLPTKESAEIDEQPVAIMNVSEGVVKNVIEDDIYENEGTVEFENSDFQLQVQFLLFKNKENNIIFIFLTLSTLHFRSLTKKEIPFHWQWNKLGNF